MDEKQKPPEQRERERPHGDKLGEAVGRKEKGERPTSQKDVPPRTGGTGDMDQPGMDPAGEEMPD